MKHLTQTEVTGFLVMCDTAVYKKSGLYLARPAMPGETVLTIVGGKVETTKATDFGDYVILNATMGASAECYAVSHDRFLDRYDNTGVVVTTYGASWFQVSAKGLIQGCFMPEDIEPFSFTASWGEKMPVYPGDFLGEPVPLNPEKFDIYRVAREEFLLTYGDTPVDG